MPSSPKANAYKDIKDEPVGKKGHKVAQGECLLSLSEQKGANWETVWNHPDNAELKKRRKDGNSLQAGDIVFFPENERREESIPEKKTTKFKVKGVPFKIRMKIVVGGKPLADADYTFECGTQVKSGKLDGDGIFEEFVPKGEKGAHLTVRKGNKEYAYEVQLSSLPPPETTQGIHARLQNLGFNPGSVMDAGGAQFVVALRRFQKAYELEDTGIADKKTIDTLDDVASGQN